MVTRAARFGAFFVLMIGVALLPQAVSAQTLSVAPTVVSAQSYTGQDASSQTVTVRNAGSKALKWSVVAPDATWLSVSPSKGTQGGSLVLTFRTSSLSAGSYQTSFLVDSNGGSMTVSVQLSVVAAVAATPPPPTGTPTLSISGPTSVTVGQQAQYTAYADGQPLTTNFWFFIYESTATIDHATGILTAVSAGSAIVRFDYLQNGVAVATTSYPITVVASASLPPKLTVLCPANQTVASQDGNSVVVNYSATTSGGVAPISVTGNPASGSAFPVGTTSVAVTAQSSDGQTASCSFTVTVTYTAPAPAPSSPSPTAVGPQSTITCPAGAVSILPGQFIQSFVNLNPGGTTFCLAAGVYNLTSAITPKTGDVFVGEYGAILDGSGWSTSDDTQAAFRAHNQDIDYVTIRNLVIRNMPQRGIHAYYYMSDHWTVEYNEITASRNLGIVFPGTSTIRNNYIHHNSYGGYMADYSSGTTLESNEIAYNGTQQKVSESANVTFRNNYVHNNAGAGIWFDSDNTSAVIEGNRLEDNGSNSIWFEIGSGVIIRNNVIRRSADTAIFISTSKNADIYGNTLENNSRGITYFVNCPSVGGGAISFDLANNSSHDNTITVGTQTYPFAAVFNYSNCTSTQVAPYANGSKSLTFTHNTYHVPSTSGQYWYWVDFKTWTQWQGIPQDSTSSMGQ